MQNKKRQDTRIKKEALALKKNLEKRKKQEQELKQIKAQKAAKNYQ